MGKEENKKTPAASAAPSLTGVDKKTYELFNAAVKASAGKVSGNSTGAVYTQAEADKDVQSVFQQALGRNAMGNEYAKGIGIAMSGGMDTSSTAKQQAILNWVQNQPEYLARQDNKYLDAIYNEIAASVANTKVR
jgi:hypothetical protein